MTEQQSWVKSGNIVSSVAKKKNGSKMPEPSQARPMAVLPQASATLASATPAKYVHKKTEKS